MKIKNQSQGGLISIIFSLIIVLFWILIFSSTLTDYEIDFTTFVIVVLIAPILYPLPFTIAIYGLKEKKKEKHFAIFSIIINIILFLLNAYLWYSLATFNIY